MILQAPIVHIISPEIRFSHPDVKLHATKRDEQGIEPAISPPLIIIWTRNQLIKCRALSAIFTPYIHVVTTTRNYVVSSG